jgi:integrase
MNEQTLVRWQEPDIDQLTTAWLDAKGGRTNSEKTRRAYRDTLAVFRAALWSAQLDLDSDPVAISLVAQGWADTAWRTGRQVSSATFDLRLSIVSSWYRYAMKKALKRFPTNPITLVERKPVQAYANAQALDPQEVQPRLAKIKTDTLAGARDYALLLVALVTGRRVAELAGMRWSHLKRLSDGRLVVHFPRCKGGKQMDDLLPPLASTAILNWLRRFYGDLEQLQPDDPVWVCLSHRAWGMPLTTRSFSRVCQAYLDTSKVHVTRHTFARTMEDAGAKVSEISMRLAQDNPAVVGRYLARLRREDNQHVDRLVSLYGFNGGASADHESSHVDAPKEA